MVIAVLEVLEFNVVYQSNKFIFMNLAKKTILFGVILLFFAVLIGAFGAHALSELLAKNNKANVFDTASRYHFYHGFALITFGILSQMYNEFRWQNIIVICFLLGLIFFSGSLYLLSILNISWLGAIAPIGGTLLLCGWVGLAYNIFINLPQSIPIHKQSDKEA